MEFFMLIIFAIMAPLKASVLKGSSVDTVLCNNTLAKEKINRKAFATAIGHGTHSLYLEPLRFFFEPNAAEENDLPVVNFKLSSSESVLLNAPLAGYDPSIPNFSLRTMDFVFRNDAADFIINKDTTVEKLGHEYHMQNLWTKTQPYYLQMKQTPPENADELCLCIKEYLRQDILEELQNIAEALRTYGNNEDGMSRSQANKKNNVNSGINGARKERSYTYLYNEAKETLDSEMDKAGEVNVKREENFSADWIPGTVKDSAKWIPYMRALTASEVSESDLVMLAKYLYCKFNH